MCAITHTRILFKKKWFRWESADEHVNQSAGANAIDDVGNVVEYGTKNDYDDDDENVEVFPEVI